MNVIPLSHNTCPKNTVQNVTGGRGLVLLYSLHLQEVIVYVES